MSPKQNGIIKKNKKEKRVKKVELVEIKKQLEENAKEINDLWRSL